MSKYLQGKYLVKNKAKYLGDYKNVIYRSSWELKFLAWCDNNDNVVGFSSEEIIVPYKSPVDNKFHRYFVDCFAKIKNKEGDVKSYLIEIKPKKQTKPPEIKKRVTKQYITEVTTWAVNEAKWKAATEFCADRGWEFKILTENDLNIT
jgi:hypothetical protein